MWKKGISPLIATVLIIGFTVALAAMVMTWGSGFIRKTTEETEASASIALKCASQLRFEISGVTCDGLNIGEVQIENRGQLEITSLKFRIVSDEGTQVYDKSGPISAFGAKRFSNFNTPPQYPNPTAVEAIASVPGDAGKEDIICGDVVEKFKVNCQ